MRKAEKLRKLLNDNAMVRIAGAHNGMSAYLVEQAGFEGVWASGLEVSTSHALPDANILTMSDYLKCAIYMNDAVSIPVVVDADTGYGNSNNVIYMVKKFEAAGIAAVCMEDKQFPKVNSFIPGRQDLASIGEFVGKIMAAKNAQETKDFCVFARVEALIAGWGQEEALKRARAYEQAGADAIFIHSKSTEKTEIETFVKSWDGNIPLIVCPTTYPSYTVEEAKKSGKVSMYIFANMGIRAAIHSMEKNLKTLVDTGDIRTVLEDISSMKKVFEIQGMPQMKASEKKYLITGEKVQAIIPAAGDDSNVKWFDDILRDRPLTLLDVNGKSILQRNLELLNNCGIQDVFVVTGYCKEKMNPEKFSAIPDTITTIENNKYKDTGIVHSVMCAKEAVSEKVVVLFSDILFEKNILERLLKRTEDVVLVIDKAYREIKTTPKKLDLVQATHTPPSGDRIISTEKDNPIVKIGVNVKDEEATHEFIGLAMFSKKGFSEFKKVYEKLSEKNTEESFHGAKSFEKADMVDMFQEMLDQGFQLSSLEVNKGWIEVHSFENYKKVCEMIKD